MNKNLKILREDQESILRNGLEHVSAHGLNIDNVDISTLIINEVSAACEYCGYGDTELIMFKLKSELDSDDEATTEDNWAVLKHWCGCLSYDETWDIKLFNSKDEAENKYFK